LAVTSFAVFALFTKLDYMGLSSAPHVVRVEVPINFWRVQRRIVHVLNYHRVPRELHEGPGPYEQHVADVRAVQLEQRDL
jgi:hypothetical protein